MSDRETGNTKHRDRCDMVKDCIICTHFDAVWERAVERNRDGDGGFDITEERIAYYCDAGGFEDNYGYAKPTQRVVCDTYDTV
jgi:hypothetical protein